MRFCCRYEFWPLCLMFSLLISGCGGSSEPADRPERTQVSGTVTYQGNPVDGAIITLLPDDPTAKGAYATTDSSGKFQLSTFGGNDGAVPGNYKVSVRKLESISAPQPNPGDPGYDPSAPEPEPKHLLPEKYADPHKSGLTVTVGQQPISDLKLELTD